MQTSDGDVETTSQQNQSSLPAQPELVNLRGENYILHNSALKRGHAEGIGEAAQALYRAIEHYKSKLTEEQIKILEPVLKGIAGQFGIRAKASMMEANTLLGKFIVANQAKSLVVKPGFFVLVWRWAFAR